ncbi:MAG: hypothetical protein QOI81_335 [Actinomycetota bacterium]|nr:hypothetical protein [Actinomycetota bacterium]
MSKQGSKGGDTGGRLTKAERQEEARRERLKIEREMAARKRNRTIGIALVVAAIVAVVAVVTFASGNKTVTSADGLPTMAALVSQAGAAAKSSGCDAVVNEPNYQNAPGNDPDIDHHHIGDTTVPTPPPLSTYASVPPTSGPHDPSPLPAGVYDSPPDVYRTVHSLEHAAVVIWYSPTIATSPEIAKIVAFYKQNGENVGQAKVIVAPYDYPDQGKSGQLPAGVEMAVAAWHRLQTCATPSLAVAFTFAAQHEFIDGTPIGGQTYIGVAREQATGI